MKISLAMKTLIVLFGVLISIAAARIVFGQTAEGVILYEVKMNMHRNIPEERAAMKNRIPEFRTSQQQLFFNTIESFYRPVEEDEDEDMDLNNGPVRMRFQQPHVEMYFNQSTSKNITQQEFMGKEYLIEDSLKLPAWKFGTETKTVIGYSCKQAMYYNAEMEEDVVAWYTPELRPFLGPETFNTLPGAVLEVNLNDGERVITAKKLDARSLKRNELKIPAKGIRISRSEFRKMVDEHMERMRANGANIIIR